MAQDFATAFYHSPAWRKNRARYLQAVVDTYGHVLKARSDGTYFYFDERGKITDVLSFNVVPPGMCERCFARGELTPAKVVHHIVHITPDNINDPKVTLAYDNFQRLCQDCHAFVHSGQEEPRVSFDEDGNIIPPDPDLEFRRQIERLTETVDERRNIHRGSHG